MAKRSILEFRPVIKELSGAEPSLRHLVWKYYHDNLPVEEASKYYCDYCLQILQEEQK